MANTDNTCSNLEIEDLYSNDTNPLKTMYDVQQSNQVNIYGYKYDEMSLHDLAQYWLMNEHALVDELHEALDALGGIKDGISSAVWKPWKAKNKDAKNLKISDLSDADIAELKMEIVDIWHFLLNYSISIGMTPDEIFNYFMSKNKENVNRQKRGY